MLVNLPTIKHEHIALNRAANTVLVSQKMSTDVECFRIHYGRPSVIGPWVRDTQLVACCALSCCNTCCVDHCNCCGYTVPGHGYCNSGTVQFAGTLHHHCISLHVFSKYISLFRSVPTDFVVCVCVCVCLCIYINIYMFIWLFICISTFSARHST